MELKQQISEKLLELGEIYQTEEIVEYIHFLAQKYSKKNHLIQRLSEFFGESTEQFVDWLLHTANPARKKLKCRYFPDCSRGAACEFFHPSELVTPT